MRGYALLSCFKLLLTSQITVLSVKSLLQTPFGVSHLLLLVMVVAVRRLVRRRREVVRSIALMVHHIQATHSDGEGRRRNANARTPWDFRRAVSSKSSVPPYITKHVQWPCRPVCIHTMRLLLRAPPAPPGATKCFQTDETQTQQPKKKLFPEKFLGRFWLGEHSFPLSLFLFWRGVTVYLERAAAVYARPPGKGLYGAQEFGKAVEP